MVGNEARIFAFTLIIQHCAGESSQYNNTQTGKRNEIHTGWKESKKFFLFLCDTLIHNKISNNLQNNTLELMSNKIKEYSINFQKSNYILRMDNHKMTFYNEFIITSKITT